MACSWSIPAAAFDLMAARAEADYPEETCGLVFGPDSALEVIPMRNLQDELRQRDPAAYPRDAHDAYHLDGVEFDRIRGEKEAKGTPFRAIYHSHPDHDAYFSKKDREDAAPPGWGPIFPEITYLVFSVRKRKVADVKGYTWSEEKGDYVEVEIQRSTGETPSADPPPRGSCR
ncbi:MAG: M67 family metallopeptidase [Planctomycetes bacterium]|nr:M67 family metallopeptidase [Planctomycetota bacterium]